jgi:hypothetical protein
MDGVRAAPLTCTAALALALLAATTGVHAQPVQVAGDVAQPPASAGMLVAPADVGVLPTVAPFPADEAGALQPRRQTLRWARYGAIAGGATGLGMGALLAIYCAGTSDGCIGVVPAFTAIGLVSGAAAGAIIGAAIPASGAGPGTIASAGLSVGVARATIGGRGRPDEALDAQRVSGTAARANVYAELTPWMGLGPEVGIASFGDAGDIRHVAVATRFMLPARRVSPFVTAHLGAYDSTEPSLEYLGGGFGAGARLHGGSRFFVDVEARYAANMQVIEPMRMQAVTISGGLYW